MTRSGKIDPAISKKLAQEIRAIARRAHNEEEVRIPVELALKDAHKLATESELDPKRLEEIETEIDKTAAELWNITATELGDIQSSLADLK